MNGRSAWRLVVVGAPLALAAARWVGDVPNEDVPARHAAALRATDPRPPVADARSEVTLLPEVELPRLTRALGAQSTDAFPAQTWDAPVTVPARVESVSVPAARPVAGVPQAPPVPFRYIGMLDTGDELILFLANKDHEFAVRQGEVVDDAYRVESVSAGKIEFTYMALNVRQSIAFESAGAPGEGQGRVVARAASPDTAPRMNRSPLNAGNRMDVTVSSNASALVPDPATQPSSAELSVAAPASATLGAEFTVHISAPATVAASKGGYVELTYHPALLAPRGSASTEPGHVRVSAADLVKGYDLIFGVIGDAPATTEVAVIGMSLKDTQGQPIAMLAPPPARIQLVR